MYILMHKYILFKEMIMVLAIQEVLLQHRLLALQFL